MRLRQHARQLGPGLITGAADDGPSGIAIYSKAGAPFGFAMLWSAALYGVIAVPITGVMMLTALAMFWTL